MNSSSDNDFFSSRGDIVEILFPYRFMNDLRVNFKGGRNVVKENTSFVVPLGYSFNLDGATLYEGIAVLFLSHVYGIHLGIGQQIAIIGTLMIMTKGLAGVPSAAVVVLIATAKAIGLPLDGIALLLGVDFFIDMARTAINVVGNSLATVVIAKSEKQFHPSGIGPSIQGDTPPVATP